MRMSTSVFLLLALAGVARAESALGIDSSTCFPLDNHLGIVMDRVVYASFASTADDYRASQKADGSYAVALRGWLYYHRSSSTETVTNRPVVIFNHGHDKKRNEPCELVKYLVANGYVVFAPLRRGHRAETPDPEPEGWKPLVSTGTHIDDYVAGCQGNLFEHGCPLCKVDGIPVPCSTTTLEVEYLHQSVADEAAAMSYIANQFQIGASTDSFPLLYLADPTHITILGHSFGGSLTLFANADLPRTVRFLDEGKLIEHNVAIMLSPAEESWNGTWRRAQIDAVSAAQRPFYVLQPSNGRSLEPTQTIVAAGADFLRVCRGAIFGPAPTLPYDPDCTTPSTCSTKPVWKQAHGNFLTKSVEVAEWGSSALEFMTRYPASYPAN